MPCWMLVLVVMVLVVTNHWAFASTAMECAQAILWLPTLPGNAGWYMLVSKKCEPCSAMKMPRLLCALSGAVWWLALMLAFPRPSRKFCSWSSRTLGVSGRLGNAAPATCWQCCWQSRTLRGPLRQEANGQIPHPSPLVSELYSKPLCCASRFRNFEPYNWD